MRPVVLCRYANTRLGGASTPKNKVPTDFVGAFFISGGDEGIRTLDTVARIPHFQCGALDQLCDVSVSDYSSSADSSNSSTTSSAVSGAISSDANEASNSASISRKAGSSLPISNDSSPSNAAGVSL